MAKVMIVDDDHTSVMLLRTLLELDDFVVSIARRGEDVLPLAEKDPPDIFLMDYHLTDMDGVEVIRHLRAHAKFANTPIVMASGLDVEEEALAAGASTFMTKPYEPEELPTLFNRLIAAG